MDAQDWSTAALAPFRPRWTKQLFTDFISFTLKLVLKGQVSGARLPLWPDHSLWGAVQGYAPRLGPPPPIALP